MTTELPYAGTSGWAGSVTSRERAAHEDSSGTTTQCQSATISFLAERREYGATYSELGKRFGWHHGQSSGVLSVLHKTDHICRLIARRDKCAIYVLPEFVGDRKVAPHGGKKSEALTILTDLIEEQRELHHRLDFECSLCDEAWPCQCVESLDRAASRLQGLS